MGLFKSGGNFELIKEPYALIFAPHTLSIYCSSLSVLIVFTI